MIESAGPAEPVALLLTDLVDSAALAQRLGDTAMAALWAAHDRLARDLLQQWQGREIDKSDGFLLLFTDAGRALQYALAYHRALAALGQTLAGAAAAGRAPDPVRLRARAGLHVGAITLRENPAADVARGAKRYEVDGLSKSVAARVMGAALGGQTLITAAARDAMGEQAPPLLAHGHWRLKGLPEPLQLFEFGGADAPSRPPPDSDKAYRVVRQDDIWLPARELRHSLPAERDAFVGRGAVLQELARRFQDGSRLVCLLGIGGGGKTRLATHFGWSWMGEFPGGIWFCDLAPARSVEGLLHAVALGLGLPLGREDPVLQLGHAIAGRGPCLMVLDNFEQLARHAEATLGRWLERAPEARFLVTTREVLGIAGEETLALAPLHAADAEELFLRRAAAARGGREPDPEDCAAIGPLVQLLDGLPLAIELAAARVRTLAPRALLARMSERFRLLASSGSRLDRQATLRAAFDWSWELLLPTEKAALAQLSVFEGGFTLEAAEAVVDAGPEAPWTLDLVHSLVDKSFVRPLGGERFDLLVSVQAYAAEHLASADRYPGSGADAVAAAEARHGAWFAALGPQRATQAACADLGNLVSACRRALRAGDADRAAGTLEGAWAAIALQGPFKAGLDLAQAVCDLPGLQGRNAARALATRGRALEALGQRPGAALDFEAALERALAAGDPAGEAAVRVGLSGLRARTGQIDSARQGYAQALDLAGRLGIGALECAAGNGLGTIEFEQGRMAEAQARYEAALDLARRIGDRRWQGSLLGNLGNLQAQVGRMAEAVARNEEALLIARELGDRVREGNTLCNLGLLHCVSGRLAAAVETSEAAHRVARDLGHVRLECVVLCNLGLVHEAAGRLPDALARYEAALALACRIGERRSEGQILGHLGLAQARLHDFDAARRSLDEGRAILARLDDGISLALLLCGRAECEWLAGQIDAARSAHDEAAALAAQCGSAAESELGVALARLARLLTAPL